MTIEKLVRSRLVVAGASAACVLVGTLACSSAPEAVVVAEPVGAPPAVVVAAAPPPAIEVAAQPPAVVPAPAHGGTVVLAGAHPVEVVPHASGQVYAYVLGDPPPPESAELTVIVPVTGGLRTVELAWEPAESRWAGRVRRAEIVPGPVDVVLVVGGQRWVGHTTTIVVLPAIVIAAPPPVIVVEHAHGKHRKHRGRGHGWGRGHGRVIRVH